MLGNFNVWALTLLRIVTAFLFWQQGAQKLFGVLGRDPVQTLDWRLYAGVLEFVGSFFVGFGLFTRPVALLLSGEMAFAYFIRHFPRGFWPILNGGEVTALFCFILLLLATAGPGKLALGNLLPRKFIDLPARQIQFNLRFNQMLDNFNPWALTLLRIVTAFLFWQHGVQKLFGVFGRYPEEFLALRWYASVLESFGSFYIGFGLLTRPVAFLLSGEMAFAYFIRHFPGGSWTTLSGTNTVLFCFIYLFLATAGPGKLALDNLLPKNSEED